MKRTPPLKSTLRTVSLLLILIGGMPIIVSAQTVGAPHHRARHNRIVGLWDVKTTILNCSTGAELFTFPALHKYELGGTGQAVPATNPTAQSAHMAIWKHVQGNDYTWAFKMFRFDAAGNNIGWTIVRNEVSINEDATEYTGSGRAEFFDLNGNLVATSCPTFTGTRFQ